MPKRLEEITQIEYNRMQKYMYFSQYSTNEFNEVIELIKNWVNPNVSNCQACGNANLSTYKNQLNEIFLRHGDKMKQILEDRAKEEALNPPVVEEAKPEVAPEPKLDYDKGLNEAMNNMLDANKSMFKKGKKK